MDDELDLMMDDEFALEEEEDGEEDEENGEEEGLTGIESIIYRNNLDHGNWGSHDRVEGARLLEPLLN